EMSRVNTIIRDSLNDTFSQIMVDDEKMYNEIRSYVHVIKPEMERLVKLYKGKVPIFEQYDVAKQIKSLFAKYVSLKRGAYLIIEHTEAMHVIDVNSGNRTKKDDSQEQTVLEVNLAAAKEIARQLRLRDMGGIVIVDFIDMAKAQSRQMLLTEMQKLMSTDKAKHTILPLSKFGLMQITRQRVRPIAMEETSDVCPTCHGTGKVEPTILLEQKIEGQVQLLAEKGVKFVELRVSPYVAAYLKRGVPSLRMRWIFKYKIRIKLTSDSSVGMIDVSYLDKKGKSLLY
ncbi:MAG: ribonuclease E/G, partial [Alistipes sp.]|nr:ribonuclease E/G [Alistipes sp.]